MKLKFQVTARFQDGAILRIPQQMTVPWKEEQNVVIISMESGKEYSVTSKIIEILSSNDEIPELIVDKRILGMISSGDHVFLHPINIPLADYVELAIEDTVRLYPGDNSPVLRPVLLNQVCDFAKELNFVVPSKISKALMATGTVVKTLPAPPVQIGQTTKIYLKKLSLDEIISFKNTADQEKGERARSYIEQIKSNTMDIIYDLKNRNLEHYTEQFKFKANPSHVFLISNQLLEGYELIKEMETPQEDTFIGGTLYIGRDELGNPDKIIEVQVTGKLGPNIEKGTLLLTIHSRSSATCVNLVKMHGSNLQKLTAGIEEGIEIIDDNCEDCGAKLPISDANERGCVTCLHCGTINSIKGLFSRYQLK